MSDNVIKSSDVTSDKPKPAKKAPAKKAAAPKKETKPTEDVAAGNVVIVFESGASYRSGDIAFTRANPIQEVSAETASRLLELDNFRIASPFEIEEFLNSKED